MTICFIVVGVWSATEHNFEVNGSIEYTAPIKGYTVELERASDESYYSPLYLYINGERYVTTASTEESEVKTIQFVSWGYYYVNVQNKTINMSMMDPSIPKYYEVYQIDDNENETFLCKVAFISSGSDGISDTFTISKNTKLKIKSVGTLAGNNTLPDTGVTIDPNEEVVDPDTSGTVVVTPIKP
jgi:hypothetical protein